MSFSGTSNWILLIPYSLGAIISWALRFGKGDSLKREFQVYEYDFKFWKNFTIGLLVIIALIKVIEMQGSTEPEMIPLKLNSK